MSNRATQLMLALGAAVFASQFATAAGPKYADPKQVDADFALQGEYTGLVGGEGDQQKFGIQVIALGKGRFEGVGYFGGLPGDGWNGEKPLRAQGEFKSGRVVFLANRIFKTTGFPYQGQGVDLSLELSRVNDDGGVRINAGHRTEKKQKKNNRQGTKKRENVRPPAAKNPGR